VQVGAINPLQIWMSPLGICKISEANMLTNPLKEKKKFHSLPHPRVASFVPPRLDKTHFQKCMYMQDVLCNVVESIMQL
jgi:hypothetical protein